MIFLTDEYTEEEIEKNGNQMYGGKIHDQICDYLQESYKFDDFQINSISMGVWLAIGAMRNKAQSQNTELKKLVSELVEAVEFYGDGWNWEPFEDKSESQVWDNDRSYWDDRPPFRSCKFSPGKRARSCLSKNKELINKLKGEKYVTKRN